MYKGDMKSIVVIDSNDLRRRRKSFGEVEIGILPGFISELSPIRVGLAEGGLTSLRCREMMFQ